jgi:hypothetical protein
MMDVLSVLGVLELLVALGNQPCVQSSAGTVGCALTVSERT